MMPTRFGSELPDHHCPAEDIARSILTGELLNSELVKRTWLCPNSGPMRVDVDAAMLDGKILCG